MFFLLAVFCFPLGCMFSLVEMMYLGINWEKVHHRILWIILIAFSLSIMFVGILAFPDKTVKYTALIDSEPLASVTEDADGRVLFSKDVSGQPGYTERRVSRIIVLDDRNAMPRRDHLREMTIRYIVLLGKVFLSEATYSDFYQYYVPRQYVETVSEYNIPELDWSDLFAVSG